MIILDRVIKCPWVGTGIV